MKNLSRLIAIALVILTGPFFGSCDPSESTPPADEPIAPKASIFPVLITQTSIEVRFTATATVASYAYAIGTAEDRDAFEAGTIDGYTVVAQDVQTEKAVSFTELIPDTSYTVFARATDKAGEKGAVVTSNLRTEMSPASVMTIDVVENNGGPVVIKFTGDENTASFSYAVGQLTDFRAFEAGTLAGIETADNNAQGTPIAFEGLELQKEYTFFARGEDRYGRKGATKTMRLVIFDPDAPIDATRCVGYLADWDWDFYQTMDWDALTHLNIAFYVPDGNGNFSDPGGFRGSLGNIIAMAHAHGVKVLGSLRECNVALLSTPQSRTNLVSNLMNYIERTGLDGFDIDLEDGSSGFWTNYEAFIVELDGRIEAEGKLLTTAVATWFSNNITGRTFACFDFINIMAYDLGWPNHSTFEDMQGMALHYRDTRGIDADRIVIGVPFYGYNKYSVNNYNDARSYWDILNRDPSAWNKDESNDYIYNGIPTIERKSEYARDFGGIMIWHLGHDAIGHPRSLLGAVKESLFYAGKAPRPVTN